MEKFEVKFNGIPSGDHECFCFDVSFGIYKHVTGKEPDKFDKSWVDPKLYRLYFTDIMKFEHKKLCQFKITVEVDPIE